MYISVAFIIILMFLIVWLTWFIYQKFIDKQLSKNYGLLSERYGLAVVDSKKIGLIHYPVTEGNVKNYPVQLGTMVNGSGKNGKVFSFVKITCTNTPGLAIQIIKKTPANKFNYSGNLQYTGDSEFDENYIINFSNAERIVDLLNFSVKYKLLQIANVDFKGKLTLDGNLLSYIEPGLIIDKRDLLRIELILHLLCEIADGLKSDGE
ncbi:MAG: hypothetical protein ABSF32_06330 [Ignavibacteria bacterium]|jgi:hypothetical protein